MTEIRWEQYPLVARHELARKWLQRQAHLQLAPNTVDAYGRCLNDYLNFCARHDTQPEAVTRDLVAQYVQDLASRPHPKGANVLSIESDRGLSNSTMQQRITVLRLFCDSLIEQQCVRIIRSAGAITSLEKLLVGHAIEDSFLITKNSPGFLLMRSGKSSCAVLRGSRFGTRS
jgi:hypothetical protein